MFKTFNKQRQIFTSLLWLLISSRQCGLMPGPKWVDQKLAQNTLFPNIFFDEFPYRGIKLISMTPPLYTPDSVEFFVISLKLSTLKPDPLLRKWEAAARMVVVTRRTRMAVATPKMFVSNCSFASSLAGNWRFNANLGRKIHSQSICFDLTWSLEKGRAPHSKSISSQLLCLPCASSPRTGRSCFWSWWGPYFPCCWTGSGWWCCRDKSKSQVLCCTPAPPEQRGCQVGLSEKAGDPSYSLHSYVDKCIPT